MTDDALMDSLLSQCLAGADPERVCRDHPDRLAEVRRRLDVLDRMEFLDASGDSPRPDPADDGRPTRRPPRLPGYELLGELGRGGMGVVYKARQTALKRVVALKLVLTGSHASDGDLVRFRTEAEAAARLNHPHIVQIYEVGEHDELPFLSMEFCDGGTLKDRLAGQPLPPDDAARVVERVARGVQAAHDKQVLHRDLKPGNVLLVHGPERAASLAEPKVSDFGLARQLDEPGLTQSGAVLGTPSYMAPEQAAGKVAELSFATDVYGLGAILYECLTGRPPFRAATTMDTLLQVMADEPVRPRLLVPGTPRDLEVIALKCLHKEPTRRYATAAELADDLQRFLNRELIKARPVGVVEKTWGWGRQRPALVTWLAVALLALVVGLPMLLYLFLSGQEKEWEAIMGRVERRLTTTEPGRRDANLQDLRRAAAMRTTNRDPARMRDRLWATLAIADVPPDPIFKTDFEAGALAFSPDGRFLAMAQFKPTAWVLPVPVLVIDLATGQRVRTLSFQPDPEWLPGAVSGQDMPLSVAFSPDGRWLAIGARSGRVHLWDLSQESPTPAIQRAVDKSRALRLFFGPDNRSLFVSHKDAGTVTRWNVEEFTRPVVQSKLGTEVGNFAVSLDGQLSAATVNGRLVLLDPATLQPIRAGVAQELAPLAYSPDGRLLAGGVGREILLMNADSGDHFRTLKLTTGGGLPVNCPDYLAFTADAAHLVAVFTSDELHAVQVWDVASGTLTTEADFSAAAVHVAAFDAGRSWVAISTNKQVVVRPLVTPPEQTVRGVQAGEVSDFAWSPDGGTLASLTHEHVAVWTEDGVRLRSRRRREGPNLPDQGGLAFHPTGDELVFHANRSSVGRWDLREGWLGEAISAQDPKVLAFDRVGRTLWGVVNGDTVRCWGWPGGEHLWDKQNTSTTGLNTLTGLAVGRDYAVTPSRSGESLLFGTAKGAYLGGWDVQDNQVLSAALTPDDRLAVLGNQKGILRLVKPVVGEGVDKVVHGNRILAVAVSPDGQLLATGSQDKTVKLFRRAGTDLTLLVTVGPLSGPVLKVGFTPDGKRLTVLVHGETAVRVWDLERFRRWLDELNLNEVGWPAVAEAPPVESPPPPVTGLKEALDRGLRLLNEGDRWVGLLWLGSGLKSLGDAADPELLRLRDQVRVRLAPPRHPPREVLAHSTRIRALAYSPDGTKLISGDRRGKVSIWDAATAEKLFPDLELDGEANGVLFLPDRQHFLVWTSGGLVRRFDLKTGGAAGNTHPHNQRVNTVVLRPDGLVFATGCADMFVRFWNAQTMKPAGDAEESPTRLDISRDVTALAYSPDGKQLLVGSPQNARFWDLATRKAIGPELPQVRGVDAVTFSSDGRAALVASDEGVLYYDPATFARLPASLPHPTHVENLTWSRDGTVIATACLNGRAYLWDAATRKVACPPLEHPDKVYSVALHPDGRTLATGCEGGRIRLWDTQPKEGSADIDVERLILTAQVLGGLELTPEGRVRVLTSEEVNERRRRLQGRGGPLPLAPTR